MSSMSTEEHPVSRKMDAGWFRPSRDQKNVLMLGGAMVLLGHLYGGALASVPIVFLSVLLYAPMYGGGAGLRTSGIDGLIMYFERWSIRRRGGNLYSYNLGDTMLSYDSTEYLKGADRTRPHRRKVSPIPAELVTVRVRTRDGDHEQLVPYLRNKDGKDDYLIAALVFDGGPKFVMSASAQRYVWDQVFISALKRAVNATTQEIELGMFVMARDADSTEPLEYVEQRWHPDFHNPEPGSVEERLVQNASHDYDEVYRDARRYLSGILVRMPFPREWKRKDLNQLTVEDVRSTDLHMVVSAIQNNLSGAVTDLRMPSLFELNELQYLLFNSENLGAFYAQQRGDLDLDAEGELKDLEDAATLKRGPFPSSIQIGNDHLIVNQTFHTSLAVVEYEGSSYPPGFLDTLFSQPFPFVFSHFVHTESFNRGMKKARNKRRFRSFGIGFLMRTNRQLHPEDQEYEQDAELEHLGLYASKSRSTLSRVIVTVQAPTHAQLQSNADIMAGSIQNHGMVTKRIYGESTQLPFLLAHSCLFQE